MQSAWDRAGILSDRSLVDTFRTVVRSRACFQAASMPHSADLMLAMPIHNCVLKMQNEAARGRGGFIRRNGRKRSRTFTRV